MQARNARQGRDASPSGPRAVAIPEELLTLQRLSCPSSTAGSGRAAARTASSEAAGPPTSFRQTPYRAAPPSKAARSGRQTPDPCASAPPPANGERRDDGVGQRDAPLGLQPCRGQQGRFIHVPQDLDVQLLDQGDATVRFRLTFFLQGDVVRLKKDRPGHDRCWLLQRLFHAVCARFVLDVRQERRCIEPVSYTHLR